MQQLTEKFDLRVQWVAFPLHPETPDQGLSLQELFAGRNFDLNAMLERLKQVAAEAGLPLAMRAMTYNSRRAQELGKWAEGLGLGEAFHMAAFSAYFAEGKNIAELSVLREVVKSLGLDPERAEQILADGVFAPAVDNDWALSRAVGVTAVPTFVAGGQAVVGAQPYPALERLVLGAQAALRTPDRP